MGMGNDNYFVSTTSINTAYWHTDTNYWFGSGLANRPYGMNKVSTRQFVLSVFQVQVVVVAPRLNTFDCLCEQQPGVNQKW